jgi:hypothetical protein
VRPSEAPRGDPTAQTHPRRRLHYAPSSSPFSFKVGAHRTEVEDLVLGLGSCTEADTFEAKLK